MLKVPLEKIEPSAEQITTKRATHCGIFWWRQAPPRDAVANTPDLKEHANEKLQARVR